MYQPLEQLGHPRNAYKVKVMGILLLTILTLYAFVTISASGKGNEDDTSYLEEMIPAKHISTARGLVSYAEIEDKIFIPHGFKISKLTTLIPTLKNVKPQTCDEIFSEWLEIANAYNVPSKAPSDFPENLEANFTMDHYAIVTKEYYNNLAVPKPNIWNQINDWMEQDPTNFAAYGETSLSVMHSLRYMDVTGMTGCVIGSQTPWVEVIALQNGAKSVLTVEYQKTTIVDNKKIDYIHPVEYAKNFGEQKEFDFAVSFSSIEHSGLQRYGDPMDPIGDIREVQKVRCMLKKGGLFFLGVPFGQDQIVYNAHRVYGPIRLAMMFEGFELVHTFRDNNSKPYPLSAKDFPPTYYPIHATFVLRKL